MYNHSSYCSKMKIYVIGSISVAVTLDGPFQQPEVNVTVVFEFACVFEQVLRKHRNYSNLMIFWSTPCLISMVF